jgi:hypothetical protein
MLVAAETRSPDVDLAAAICLEGRNQKRNHPSRCRATAFPMDVNHLKAQRKAKTPVNSRRKTLHKGGYLKDTLLKYP